MTVRAAAAATCSRYKAVIDRWNGQATVDLAASGGVTNDPFAAADYRDRTTWLLTTDHASRLQVQVRAISTRRLRGLVRSRHLTPKMIGRFTADALFVCKELAAYKNTLGLVRSLDARAVEIVTEADLKPWYPKGFNEFSDGIAWRWQSNPSCDTGLGAACWGIDLVVRDGCPTSVYAEVNISNTAGTAVDYSNDTLGGLESGQTGQVTFESFDSGAHTVRLSDISCY